MVWWEDLEERAESDEPEAPTLQQTLDQVHLLSYRP